MKITHILVPTDFSPFSDLAIQQASFFANQFEAKTTMLHVLTMAEVNTLTAQPGNPWENVVGQIQNTMREQFINAIESSGIGAQEPTLEVAVGEPAEEITRFAEENRVDHIVLGTHGRTGLASLFLGSITVEVIKKTCIPLTVVKCPEFFS